MMKTLLKHAVWSLSIGLMMWVTMSATVPVSVQGLSLSSKHQREIEDRLFDSLSGDSETLKELAGGVLSRIVVGLEMLDVKLEVGDFSIGSVWTTGVETPLILAEQYSTNCSTEPLERTFSFSKTKEHSKTITFQDAQAAENMGLTTGSAALDLIMNNVMERAEEKANFPIRKLLGIIGGGNSDDSGGPTETEATTESESTQWQDSMKATIGSGQIGRGRLLVTENKANIDFTRTIKIDGKFRPRYEDVEREPITVRFFRKNSFREVTKNSGRGAYGWKYSPSGIVGFNYKGSDLWLRVGWMGGRHISWVTLTYDNPTSTSLVPPREIKIAAHNDRDVTMTSSTITATVLQAKEVSVEGKTWKSVDLPPGLLELDMYWIADLSRPYACFYPHANFKLPDDGTPSQSVLCTNAVGYDNVLAGEYDTGISSLFFHKGVKVVIWNASGTKRELPDEDLIESGSILRVGNWYLIPDLSTMQFNDSITKIQVHSSGNEEGIFNLDDYFTTEELQFEQTGTFTAVYQTNASAEAVSSPATWERCECDTYPSRGVCADLARIPAGVTVKTQGNGVVQYGNYRYRDQVMIDFQENESITAALTAIPGLGFQFAEWRSAAGASLSGTYSPQPGETITAVFESDSVAAGRKTLRVEASSSAAVGIKNFQCLKDGVWQQMNPEWNGDRKNGTSTVAGAYAQATCDGEVATVTLQTGPGMGPAQVSLNGQPVRTFDCSAEQAGSLTYDSREKTVRLTIPDNPGGDTVLRSFKYQNDAGQWQEVVVVNNAGKIDPRVYVSTDWSNYKNHFMISRTPGAYAEFSFVGKAVVVRLQRGSGDSPRGLVEVMLDGRSKGRINTDYGRGGYAEHDFTLYVEDEKTVRIENAGRRNTASGGYAIQVNSLTYIDHAGNAQTIACADSASLPVVKDGSWNDACTTSKSGGALEFTGNVTQIDLQTGADFGFAKIFVDGEFNQEVDLYSAAPGSKVIILKPGTPPRMEVPATLPPPFAPLPGPKPENTPLPPREGIPKVPGRKSSSM